MDLTLLVVVVLYLPNLRGAHPSRPTEYNVAQKESSMNNTFGASLTGLRRLKRQNNCGPQEYWEEASNKCCPRCPAGRYLKKTCSKTETSVCRECEPNTFTESENILYSCDRCKSCQKGNGHETDENCTTTHDTKCRCRSNFFCETPGPCNRCSSCKECAADTEEVVRACTSVNNTVCRPKTEGNGSYLGWLALIPIIMIGVLVLYWTRKSLPCKRKPENKNLGEQVPLNAVNGQNSEEPVVPEVDLSDGQLQMIADEIEPRSYHQLGLSLGLTEPKLQQIEADYRDDKSRQGFTILYEWYQSNGKRGALPKLIGVLRNLGWVRPAENILQKLDVDEKTVVETAEKDVSEKS
ncbi:tumor necrosis factor receptor superfamily member 6-like [Rhinoraja longicauda]